MGQLEGRLTQWVVDKAKWELRRYRPRLVGLGLGLQRPGTRVQGAFELVSPSACSSA